MFEEDLERKVTVAPGGSCDWHAPSMRPGWPFARS